MRDHFWVADMAGVDWAAELARYRPLVDAVGSVDDLVDVLWEVNGRAGHVARVRVGGWRRRLVGTTRAAGRRPRSATDDGWRVVRVLPPETSAPDARSPLAGPGVDVRAGDVILDVAGRPVDPEWGPAPLLVGTANRLVELTVRTGPDRDGAGEVRRVVVKPLSSESELRYQDWVAGRRAFVADRSEGRLGYLHVPDMVASGWAQLHRDLGRETARDGLDPRRARQQRRPHLAAGGREAGPAGDRLGRAAAPSGLPLPRRRAPRPGGRAGRRALRLGRRHRHRRDQAAGHRAGDRDPDLGRGDRHRRPLLARGRHPGDPAAVRVVVRRLRLGRREPGCRPGHRGGRSRRRTTRRAATRSWSGRSTWRWSGWRSARPPGPRTRPRARPAAARTCPRAGEAREQVGGSAWWGRTP